MYENMKPKDAADLRPARHEGADRGREPDEAAQMSEILAQMTPEAAERLTVELANRADDKPTRAPDELPKIEGKPGGTEPRSQPRLTLR